MRPTAIDHAWRFVAAGALLIIVISGCTDTTGSISTVYPVKGRVILPDGKPLTSGTIVLVSNRGQEFSGKLGPDGRFTIKSGVGDGAPEGEYVVRLDADAQAATGSTRIKKGSAGLPFPAKYADETTSDERVTVKPGENNFDPIKLLSGSATPNSTSGKERSPRG